MQSCGSVALTRLPYVWSSPLGNLANRGSRPQQPGAPATRLVSPGHANSIGGRPGPVSHFTEGPLVTPDTWHRTLSRDTPLRQAELRANGVPANRGAPGKSKANSRARDIRGTSKSPEARFRAFALVIHHALLTRVMICQIADDSLPRFESWTCHPFARSGPVREPGPATRGSGAEYRRCSLCRRKARPAASSKTRADQPGCENTRPGLPLSRGRRAARSGSCAKCVPKNSPCGGSRGGRGM
jgi:hypothetical protein